MKTITYFVIGLFFGVIMYKSEAASWFRIYEMFQFASFHMYGIFASALAVGTLGIQWIKKNNIKTVGGRDIDISVKTLSVPRHLFGGVLFGLGWALAGVCPGPIYVLAGAGYLSILVVLGGAIMGAFSYGLLKKYLPH